jgi:hypothetical protein
VQIGGSASETKSRAVTQNLLWRRASWLSRSGAGSRAGVTAALRVQPDIGQESAEGGAVGQLGGHDA